MPALAAGALAAVALAAGLAVAATGVLGSGHGAPTHPLAAVHPGPRTTAVGTTPPPAHAATAHRAAAPAHHTAPHPATTPTPAASTTTTATTPAPPPAPDAVALETRGHALLEGGSAAAAVPVLRQAVSSAQPGSTTYAYALFDLGSALRQAGDTRDAVRVLYSRLQIPNQTDKVRAELALALQALGRRAASGGSSQGAADRPSSSASPPGPTAEVGAGNGNVQGSGD